MVRSSLALLPVLLAACSAVDPGPGAAVLFQPNLKPIVMVEVRDVPHPPSTEGLAWCFFTRGGGPYGMPARDILAAADSAGMLLMLVQREPLIQLPGTRQHIDLELDRDHLPVGIHPEGLRAELEGLVLTPDTEGQRIILNLREKYRPDMIYVFLDPPGPAALGELASFWADAALNRDIRFVLFSPPSHESRGWCAMYWRGIPGGFVPGLTFGGFGKTLAILAGLPWDPSVFTGVPAATLLVEQIQ